METPFSGEAGQEELLAYDRAQLDAYFAAVKAERERLEQAIADGRRRIEAAKETLEGPTDVREQVLAMIEKTHRIVSDLWEDNDRAVEAILVAADAEADAIVAAARAGDDFEAVLDERSAHPSSGSIADDEPNPGWRPSIVPDPPEHLAAG
jgi:cell division septum initiation protein DivIVA